MSVARHGWNSDDNLVRHPNPESSPIAVIHTRVVGTDLALVAVAPDVIYTNDKYFEGPTPQNSSLESMSTSLTLCFNSMVRTGLQTVFAGSN